MNAHFQPPQTALQGRGRSRGRFRALPALGPGPAHAALCRRVLGQGHPRRHDPKHDGQGASRPTSPGRGVPRTPRCSSQGTELVALQRDNLEMGNIAPQDISKQIPAWSHADLGLPVPRRQPPQRNFFASPTWAREMKKMVEDQLKVKVLGPTFFGTRHVGLKTKKKINVPADLAGVKLRMPPGDSLAVAGPFDRRQPHAHGLRRDLHRPADRRDRRAGQPAAQRAEHEVQRGHVSRSC